MFLLFSQIPALIETLDPQPLEELLPGEERAHPDPIGIRDGFSFLNSWSGGHLSAVSEDICVGHDVQGNKGNFLCMMGQENPESVVASISEGLRALWEPLFC